MEDTKAEQTSEPNTTHKVKATAADRQSGFGAPANLADRQTEWFRLIGLGSCKGKGQNPLGCEAGSTFHPSNPFNIFDLRSPPHARSVNREPLTQRTVR